MARPAKMDSSLRTVNSRNSSEDGFRVATAYTALDWRSTAPEQYLSQHMACLCTSGLTVKLTARLHI